METLIVKDLVWLIVIALPIKDLLFRLTDTGPLEGQSHLVLAQELVDLHEDHSCHHVNILDDVLMAKLLSWLLRHSMVR